MTQEEIFAEQRRTNKVAYAIEDFYDSIGDIKHLWMGHLALIGFLALSMIFGAANTIHIVFCLAAIALGVAAQYQLDLTRSASLLASIGGYLLLCAIEFGVYGFPDSLIHSLSLEQGWRGTVPTLNALTPIIYVVARVALVYVLVNVWLRRKALVAQPISTVRKLDRELAMKLE